MTLLSSFAARVLTISLNPGSSSESGPLRMSTQGEFSIPTLQAITAIDVDLGIALLSNMMTSFDIVNWKTKAQATVALADDPGETLVSLIKVESNHINVCLLSSRT